jgi:hypothetical protein
LERLLRVGKCPDTTYTFIRHHSLASLPPIEPGRKCPRCHRYHEITVHEVPIRSRAEAKTLERLERGERVSRNGD